MPRAGGLRPKVAIGARPDLDKSPVSGAGFVEHGDVPARAAGAGQAGGQRVRPAGVDIGRAAVSVDPRVANMTIAAPGCAQPPGFLP